MTALPARLALRELLVQPSRIEQHEVGQLDRPACRVDGSAEAFAHGDRQQAAVIEVGVGQENRVEPRGIESQRDAVADRLVRAALEHAAVDQDARTLGREQEARAGYGRRATQEVDVHRRMVTGAVAHRL